MTFWPVLVLLNAFLLPAAAHGDLLVSDYNAKFIIADDWTFYFAIADEPTGISRKGFRAARMGRF